MLDGHSNLMLVWLCSPTPGTRSSNEGPVLVACILPLGQLQSDQAVHSPPCWELHRVRAHRLFANEGAGGEDSLLGSGTVGKHLQRHHESE